MRPAFSRVLVALVVGLVAAATLHADKLKAIAVTSAERDPQLPDAPTMRESGFPQLEKAGWQDLLGPAGIARSQLAYALTVTGGTDEAYEILHALVAQSQTAYVSPVGIALVLIAPGQNTQALDWLDRAHTVRDLRLMYL